MKLLVIHSFVILEFDRHAGRGITLFFLKFAFALCLVCATTQSQAGRLIIESWRTDDVELWNAKILPEFHKLYPDIHVVFSPVTNTSYDINTKTGLREKTAGDLITCRPFDASLELFSAGHLLELSHLVDLSPYRSIAKAAWTTDDGAGIFCLPLAFVGHGFFFNKAVFNDLGIQIPKTEDEFFELLGVIQKKTKGKITPIAFGTKDKWEATQTLMSIVGPNHWKGEVGRRALLNGTSKFTDEAFIQTWEKMAALSKYFPIDFEKISYEDARELFASGQAAIFPSGSWDISHIESIDPDNFGVFRYPLIQATDDCYVTNHLDSGIGINAASSNVQDAKIFLNWLTTRDFSNLFANTLIGFYPLASFPVNTQSETANEMFRWRRTCKSTLRINSQQLERGPESFENLLWDVNAEVLNLTITPASAATRVQRSLDSWFYKTME
jgi:raffinose/stachyose/melibiose transport system substrate-binding protein